jgi:hypothetical protein
MGTTARAYANPGTCNDGLGTCSYAPADATCQFGCSGGLCVGDPCSGITCNSPPPSVCADAWTLLIYGSSGTCSGGTCSYGTSTSSCANGCGGGACLPCNASTCPYGCCSANNCLDNDTSCRGSGGITCHAGCGANRICDTGTCVPNCGLPVLKDPNGQPTSQQICP